MYYLKIQEWVSCLSCVTDFTIMLFINYSASLSDLLHSVKQALGSSTSLELTQIHSSWNLERLVNLFSGKEWRHRCREWTCGRSGGGREREKRGK